MQGHRVGRKASASQFTSLVTITREEDEVNPTSLLDYLEYQGLATRHGGGIEENFTRPGGVGTFLSLPVVKLGTEHSVVVMKVDIPGVM